MAQKLADTGYLEGFAGGQGAGDSLYFDVAPDLDTNFGLIRVTVDALVDEINGVAGPNTVLPLDIFEATDVGVVDGRIGDHSYKGAIATTSTTDDSVTIADGAALVSSSRYQKTTGTTTFIGTGGAGSRYFVLGSNGNVTQELVSGVAFDLYVGTWDGAAFTALTESMPVLPDADDLQDCLTAVGNASAGPPAETHKKIADRLENIERILRAVTTNITGGTALGPIAIGGSSGSPGLILSDGSTYDTGTGMFRLNVNEIGFSVSGTERARILSTGIGLNQNGSASANTLFRVGQANTGLHFPAVDEVGLSANGTLGLRIAEGIAHLPANPVGRARQDSQAISTGAGQAITFDDAEDFDVAAQHDPSTNPERVTIGSADEAGKYRVSCTVRWEEAGETASAQRQLDLTLDGSAVTGLQALRPGDGTDDFCQTVTGIMDLANTNYIGCLATQDSGSDIDITDAVICWEKIA